LRRTPPYSAGGSTIAGCGAPSVHRSARPPRRLDRIGDQLVDVDVRVGDAVHERRVGAVLQQAADQVREQRLVGADRRIDAARPAEPAVSARRDDVGVQRLAHPVQALELVAPALGVVTGERRDRAQRVRVVGRELRLDRIGRASSWRAAARYETSVWHLRVKTG
jgi:hypothetical protein